MGHRGRRWVRRLRWGLSVQSGFLPFKKALDRNNLE